MDTEGGIGIFLTDGQVRAIRRRGHGATASEIRRTVCRWQGMLAAGEKELAAEFSDDELSKIVGAVAGAARADRLNHEELWGMGAQRIARIVEFFDGDRDIAGRCLELSELAAMAIKERAGEVVPLPTGKGGRRKKK